MSATRSASTGLSAPPAIYHPEAIWQARRSFFEQGRAPRGVVADGVLRSWERCTESGHDVHASVEFQPVLRSHVSELLARHAALVEAAQPELTDLAASVVNAGYAVLLTDDLGHALVVDGAIAQRSAPFRQAFRAGVDLSESAIGTNAMAVALREAQPARVLGAEHFFAQTQIFHCSAAPVFDPQGSVIGSVDVSRDMPGMVDSALWLAARCAQRIERRLFLAQAASIHIEIDAGMMPGAPSHGSGAWLAFGPSGELVAANRSARSLLGLPAGPLHLRFESLFDARFGEWISTLRRAPRTGATMRFKDGIALHASAMQMPDAWASASIAVARNAPTSLRTPVLQLGDAALGKAYERTARAFAAGLPILLSGETGTGKEVVAQALHRRSDRAQAPFIALNCAAVPAELFASELFGHVEGAFTGARRGGAVGKIEAAHGGTLFLDEIGDLPLALQATLLRVLDSGEVVRVGSHQARSVDFRLICATHRPLATLVADGAFRQDLLYRIAGYTFTLTPLRQRGDFDALLDTLLRRFGGTPDQVPDALREQLRARPWEGNLRELSHAVQRALALAEPGTVLDASDFPSAAGRAASAPLPESTPSPHRGLLQQATDHAIDEALAQAHGNVTLAAQRLGMGRSTLYRRLRSR